LSFVPKMQDNLSPTGIVLKFLRQIPDPQTATNRDVARIRLAFTGQYLQQTFLVAAVAAHQPELVKEWDGCRVQALSPPANVRRPAGGASQHYTVPRRRAVRPASPRSTRALANPVQGSGTLRTRNPRISPPGCNVVWMLR
jgi:hypothetical protein